MNKDFHIIEKERQDLIILKESQAAKILSLRRSLQELTTNRQKEFHLMSNHIQQSVTRELELLRANFHISVEDNHPDEDSDKSRHGQERDQSKRENNDPRDVNKSFESVADQSMMSDKSFDSH